MLRSLFLVRGSIRILKCPVMSKKLPSKIGSHSKLHAWSLFGLVASDAQAPAGLLRAPPRRRAGAAEAHLALALQARARRRRPRRTPEPGLRLSRRSRLSPAAPKKPGSRGLAPERSRRRFSGAAVSRLHRANRVKFLKYMFEYATQIH